MRIHAIKKENVPELIRDEDGIPVILPSDHPSLHTKEETPPPEDPVEKDKREKLIVKKLWAKARRPYGPRKVENTTKVIHRGCYISPQDIHEPAAWFAKMGGARKGAWLHKSTEFHKWGTTFSEDRKEVVQRDQTIMRILCGFSRPTGPTLDEVKEADDLDKKDRAEKREADRKEAARQAKTPKKRKYEESEPDDSQSGGMVPSKINPGILIPLGWDEEKNDMGTGEDIDRDYEQRKAEGMKITKDMEYS